RCNSSAPTTWRSVSALPENNGHRIRRIDLDPAPDKSESSLETTCVWSLRGLRQAAAGACFAPVNSWAALTEQIGNPRFQWIRPARNEPARHADRHALCRSPLSQTEARRPEWPPLRAIAQISDHSR